MFSLIAYSLSHHEKKIQKKICLWDDVGVRKRRQSFHLFLERHIIQFIREQSETHVLDVFCADSLSLRYKNNTARIR